jgi:hypothetical protein
MRHGRLASALVLAAFSGLAAAQAPNSQFAADREPETAPPAPSLPALPSAARVVPAVLGLPAVIQDKSAPKADDKAAPKADDKSTPPNTDKAKIPADPKQMPPSADPAKTTPAPLPTPMTVPPTASVYPPGGIVLAPEGGTVLFGDGAPAAGNGYWVSAEYLRWKIKKDETPPLVTTGPATFPVAFLGRPGTRVLFGGELDPGTLSGVRISGGLWLDDCHTWGLEASGFWFHDKNNSTTFNSSQFPVLARPFQDVNPSGQNSEFLAFPGLATGSITVQDKTQFCGATIGTRCPFWSGCYGSVDAIGGLQFLNLKEDLSVVENVLGLPGVGITVPGAAGTRFVVTDTFKTQNRFYGAFVGADAHTNYGCWTFGLTAQIGAGCNHEEVDISGSQVATTATGVRTTTAGGLLALPGANIGKFTKNEFSFVPQIGLNVGYQVCDNITVFAGYDCLYWSHVLRPGTEIDPVLNVNRIPNFGGGPAATSARPIVPFNQQSFWAQGVSVGVKFSW